VASSFGYKLFKAESVDDIPFEKYRVLVALINKTNEEAENSADIHDAQSASSHKDNKRTTYRIVNED
jgi:hypothetical protein